MEEYARGWCYECDGPILFPSHVALEEVECPHCGKIITLALCNPDVHPQGIGRNNPENCPEPALFPESFW